MEILKTSVLAGARYVGFVFFKKSPRNINIEDARKLATHTPPGVIKTGLFVNAGDNFISNVLKEVPLDMIQLHGTEDNQRIQEIKHKYKLPVMKAIGIHDQSDLDSIDNYNAADQLLLDAKPHPSAQLPGGNGIAFDWNYLKNVEIKKPWMLAGGLNPTNVAQAIKTSGAKQVDVSSGVEIASGIKSKKLIEEFIDQTKVAK